MDERAALIALLDRTGEHWRALAKELGGLEIAEKYRRALQKAAWSYFDHQKFNLRFTRERKARLERLIRKTRSLEDELKTDLDWISFVSEDELSSECILPTERGSPLGEFAESLERYLAEENPERGQPAKKPRRQAWLRAALVYEDATGRTAGSSSKNDSNERTGPFIRFLTAFSAPLMPQDPATPQKILEFLAWRQTDEGQLQDAFAKTPERLRDKSPR